MGSKSILTEELSALGQTDADNANRFVLRMKERFFYCPQRKGWLRWTGHRWRLIEHKGILKFAIEVAKKIKYEVQYLTSDDDKSNRRKHAKYSLGRSGMENMLHIAAGLMSVDIDKLDQDHWLLNVKNGTIDLKTGKMLPHTPSNYITKRVPINFDPEAKCPTFKRFLKTVLGSDKNLHAELQKACGYSLAGEYSEKIFFITYGPHDSGKSTFVSYVLRELLGEYATVTSANTFMVKQFDNNIPNDMAALKGARAICVSEVNAGKQFDEAKIKQWTGGDPQKARFMKGEYFEFMPIGKLWMALNDLPRVRDTDGAFWARVRVFPFSNTIPKSKIQRKFTETLKPELPGILAWAVRGCLKWQKVGLSESGAMLHARKSYKTKIDHVDIFLREACVIGPGLKTYCKPLLQSYKGWCHQKHENPLTRPELWARLHEHDLTKSDDNKGNYWLGIELKSHGV